MAGRIFLCHHNVPERLLSTNLFSTLVSGVYDNADTGLLGDLGGMNIATENAHSEMRHHYHVWKERLHGLDYVGFEHYRRVFFIQPLGLRTLGTYDINLGNVARSFARAHGHVGEVIDPHIYYRYLDLREIAADGIKALVDDLMERHDLVTQRLHSHQIEEQWKSCHNPDDWKPFADAVRSTRFYRSCNEAVDLELRSLCYCNMYIMRTDVFREYMEFWWEVMCYLKPLVSTADRYLGYFAERLPSLFLNGCLLRDPRFRATTLPFVIRR